MAAKILASTLAAIVLCACRSAQGWAQAVEARQRACTTGAWSAPREVRLAPDMPAWISGAGIVENGRDVLLFGRTTVWNTVSDSLRVRERGAGGVRMSPEGITIVPSPQGTRWLSEPRALAGPGGIAHLFWGTGDSTGPPRLAVDTVWHAEFDGKHWSTPEVVLERAQPRKLEWNGTSESVTIAPDGRLIVAVPTRDTTLIARRGNGRWSVSTVAFGAAYTAVAAGADGKVVLSTSSTSFRDLGIQVMRSSDGGATWGDGEYLLRIPVPVARPGAPVTTSVGIPADLQLVPSQFAWYLVATHGSTAQTPDTVYAFVSRDRGDTWQRMPAAPFLDGVHALRAVADRNGALYVAGTSRFGGGQIVAARWDGQTWCMVGSPRPEAADPLWQVAGPVSLAILQRDSIYLSWAAFRGAASDVARYLAGAPGLPVTVIAKVVVPKGP